MNPASVPDHKEIAKLGPDAAKSLFVNKSVWQRMAIVVAGPAANVLFTFLVLYVMLVSYGRLTLDPVIDEVLPGSVAEIAGFESGDRVIAVDGYTVRGFEDFQRLVATAPERRVSVVVDRAGTQQNIIVVPESDEMTDRFGNTHRVGRIGVSRAVGDDDVTLYQPGPVEAIGMTAEEVSFIITRTAAFLGDFFVGRGDVDQIGGPVRVAQVSGEVATLGVLALVNLTALLSLNIGIINLLPVPMLDGGHLMYYLYEAIRGKPLSQRVQEFGFRVGLALVCTLMVFTLVNDIF
jgi:regulator of sigma E protease